MHGRQHHAENITSCAGRRSSMPADKDMALLRRQDVRRAVSNHQSTPLAAASGVLVGIRLEAAGQGGTAVRAFRGPLGLPAAEVDQALGHAAVSARFGEGDLASILDHHARGLPGPGQRAGGALAGSGHGEVGGARRWRRGRGDGVTTTVARAVPSHSGCPGTASSSRGP